MLLTAVTNSPVVTHGALSTEQPLSQPVRRSARFRLRRKEAGSQSNIERPGGQHSDEVLGCEACHHSSEAILNSAFDQDTTIQIVCHPIMCWKIRKYREERTVVPLNGHEVGWEEQAPGSVNKTNDLMGRLYHRTCG